MKKLFNKLIVTTMAFIMIITLFTPFDAQAASSYESANRWGDPIKCGSYYIKRTTKGIYAKKSKTAKYKKIVSCKSTYDIGYSFTTNGSYIYYADNNTKTKRGTIYRIKVSGKSKKKIYYAKHMVDVMYYYSDNILYESDTDGDKEMGDEDGYYILNVTKALKKSKTPWYEAAGGECTLKQYSGSKVLFVNESGEEDWRNTPAVIYDMKGHNIRWEDEGFELYDSDCFQLDSTEFYYAELINTRCVKIHSTYYDEDYCRDVFTVQIKKVDLTTGTVTNMTEEIDMLSLIGVSSENVTYVAPEDDSTRTTLDFN